MQFLYSGGILYQSQPEKVLEVGLPIYHPSLLSLLALEPSLSMEDIYTYCIFSSF